MANIPIAKITDDFLGYIREAKALDISLAGEFIVVAATLVSIKARVLLPRLGRDETGREVDPRQELIDRLVEYRRYRGIVDEMRALEETRSQQFSRPLVEQLSGEILGDARAEAEWESVTLYKLLRAFERVLARQQQRETRPVHRVMRWPYTVEEERERILRNVRLRGCVPFAMLFDVRINRIHAIVTFLALLELLNAAQVGIQVSGDEVNDFLIKEPMHEPRDPGALALRAESNRLTASAVGDWSAIAEVK